MESKEDVGKWENSELESSIPWCLIATKQSLIIR